MGQRKDKTVQARIPAQLDRELRKRAERLGLSVSTVVRNVLLNTFDLVEGIVADSAQIARNLTDAAPEGGVRPCAPEGRPRPVSTAGKDTSAILGWQELTLNVNAVCESCNAVLRRGARAAIGVPAHNRPAFLCLDCLSALAAPERLAKGEARRFAKPRGKR